MEDYIFVCYQEKYSQRFVDVIVWRGKLDVFLDDLMCQGIEGTVNIFEVSEAFNGSLVRGEWIEQRKV